jgi:hypothetical protein
MKLRWDTVYITGSRTITFCCPKTYSLIDEACHDQRDLLLVSLKKTDTQEAAARLYIHVTSNSRRCVMHADIQTKKTHIHSSSLDRCRRSEHPGNVRHPSPSLCVLRVPFRVAVIPSSLHVLSPVYLYFRRKRSAGSSR